MNWTIISKLASPLKMLKINQVIWRVWSHFEEMQIMTISIMLYDYNMYIHHVWMWELDYKESWEQNWCFWTVVLEKTLESPLNCKNIQPVHPKGNQSWIFIGRTNVEAEAPILWPPDAKSWFIGKDPDSERDCGQEEKGTTEDEIVGWHHWVDWQVFEQAPGVDDGEEGLVYCSPWGCRVGHDWVTELTERLYIFTQKVLHVWVFKSQYSNTSSIVSYLWKWKAYIYAQSWLRNV